MSESKTVTSNDVISAQMQMYKAIESLQVCLKVYNDIAAVLFNTCVEQSNKLNDYTREGKVEEVK
jgi:hypothetical protein